MNALRTLGLSIVAAGLVAAVPASAQENPALNGGWNTQYGMLFTLQNVFMRQSIVDGYGGGVGVQYNLAPTRALRLKVDLHRASDDAVVTERTVTTPAGTTTQKFMDVPAYTSQYDVGVAGMYMMRLGTAALAPYLGGGVSLGYRSEALAYTNDIDPANVTKVDDATRTFDVGLDGQLGLEWRVHKSVSLFAEYGLSIVAMRHETVNDETTNGGTTVKVESSKNTFFNFDTGIAQAGQLGLVAFF